METELLRKIINVYMDEYKFIPFAIKNYIEGKWNTFRRYDQLLICQLLKDRLDYDKLHNKHDSQWLDLYWWMKSRIKTNDITWDASK